MKNNGFYFAPTNKSFNKAQEFSNELFFLSFYVRFQHEDDEIIVENVFQEVDSFLDRDDKVIDVLDDRETVSF